MNAHCCLPHASANCSRCSFPTTWRRAHCRTTAAFWVTRTVSVRSGKDATGGPATCGYLTEFAPWGRTGFSPQELPPDRAAMVGLRSLESASLRTLYPKSLITSAVLMLTTFSIQLDSGGSEKGRTGGMTVIDSWCHFPGFFLCRDPTSPLAELFCNEGEVKPGLGPQAGQRAKSFRWGCSPPHCAHCAHKLILFQLLSLSTQLSCP